MDIRDPEYRGMVELALDRKDEILALETENKKLRDLWEKALPFEMVPDEIQYLKQQALKG